MTASRQALTVALLALCATEVKADMNVSIQGEENCSCIAFGRRYLQGETACIRGQRMVCSLRGNLSSWISKGEPCLSSRHLQHNRRSWTLLAAGRGPQAIPVFPIEFEGE